MTSGTTTASDTYEVHYGLALVAGVLIGIGAVVIGQPVNVALAGAIMALVAGLLYEALAAHHPLVAKLAAQLGVGLIAMVTVIAGILVVVLVAALGASTRTRRR